MFPLIFSTIKNENERTFMEQLYMDYHKLMYAQVRRLTKDNYDVEEIVQESLLHLIEKVNLLQSLPKDRLVNYIISTARYTGYAYFRKRRRNELISFDDVEFAQADCQTSMNGLDELVIQKIENEQLYYVWTSLKERDQMLLNMKYILGYTNKEIAKVFDVKPESIRMMLTRAKRNLSTELEKAMSN